MKTQDTKFCEDEKKLARFAKALGHPARIKIIKLLGSRDACFCGNIVDYIPLSQSTVSQHLKELKDAGLIYDKVQPPKVYYCINKDNWEIAKSLFNDLFDISVNVECH